MVAISLPNSAALYRVPATHHDVSRHSQSKNGDERDSKKQAAKLLPDALYAVLKTPSLSRGF